MELVENNERIIIYDLEIENFKSYAGKRRLGPFHKSFTSVVGANGSGKSNVIDSILFVFGYRSSRIRSKKLSLLIHNSEKYPNVQKCSVLVEFRKVIDDVIDPDFKLTISRVAYKDSSNDYYLNGAKSSFKEVTQLLRNFGVDLDYNRFLILQGEVEQISLMKPKGTSENDEGLLEFLEDIIGSMKYKKPIEDLTKVVDGYLEQMVEKINRVKVVEKEKDSLEPSKNEAVKYINHENKLNYLHFLDYMIKLKELEQQDSETIAIQQQLKGEKQILETKIDEIEIQKEEKHSELNEVQKISNPLIKSIEAHKKVVLNLERSFLKAKQVCF
ncbi:Structural maintenance of chromosomes protein 4 [Thelohanellus kitauei]|uniref:Structural maintenance of chromosomes protein 4 n=1 Tax=Thelohanellus kitauei TaxID=669202 RepID=A0A0C2MWG6_THEKT|nr:Structural maintenance of chromosomes protein 4 [Thelohanellus kitauei]